MAEPDFKQQYLAPIRSLQEQDQCHLLQKVIDKPYCSLRMQQPKMNCLKKAFLKLVNVETWNEAKDKSPLFATTKNLEKFVKVDLKHGIPQSFTDLCTRAKHSLGQITESAESNVIIKTPNSSSTIHVMQAMFTKLSSAKITGVYQLHELTRFAM